MSQKISCTVALLTHNSSDTLPRALDSIIEFAEIIVCDGGSTDNTLAIARARGTRVIEQSKNFLYPDGRIKDFAGVRNQTLAAANYEWFFFLDSDEYLTVELVAEIRAIILAGEPAAYWVPRNYVLHGVVIDHANTYPAQQMRFFNRACTIQFIKEVHERVQLKEGVVPKHCNNYMLVPLPLSVKEMKDKWRRYLAIESSRYTHLTLKDWARSVIRQSLIACLYVWRTVRIRLFNRGTHLPLSYEMARVWYQLAFIRMLTSRLGL